MDRATVFHAGRSTVGSMQVVSRTFCSRGLASLGPPIGISIGTNSDRELGDSAGFLRRGEKSLNRRSYRCAPLIDETPRLPILRTATRDKDPISTSRSRKGYAASSCLHPLRISLSDISAMESREVSSAPNQLCEMHSGYILFSSYDLLSFECIFFLFSIYLYHNWIYVCGRDLIQSRIRF